MAVTSDIMTERMIDTGPITVSKETIRGTVARGVVADYGSENTVFLLFMVEYRFWEYDVMFRTLRSI